MNKLIEWVKSLLSKKPTSADEPTPSATEVPAEVTETKADTSPAITPEATPTAETKEQEVSEPSGGNAVEEPPQFVSEPSTHTSPSVEPPSVEPPPEEK